MKNDFEYLPPILLVSYLVVFGSDRRWLQQKIVFFSYFAVS